MIHIGSGPNIDNRLANNLSWLKYFIVFIGLSGHILG